MKQLMIEKEGVINLEHFELACEGILDFINPQEKETSPTAFDTKKAFEKIKNYNSNPQNFTINPKRIKDRLFFSLNGQAPETATDLVIALDKTLRQIYTVASKLEKDRLSQALILGATINTFNINMGDNIQSSGKVAKVVATQVMQRVMRDAQRASDSYFGYVGNRIQKEAESWLGGSPFNLKIKPETGRYRNAGGGKLKAVGPAPIANKGGIERLVSLFLKNANPKAGTFDHSALDDKSFKYYVDYKIDPDLKSVATLKKEQRQALNIVFSGKSNSQTLQYELCEATKKIYVSLLIYLSAVLIEK